MSTSVNQYSSEIELPDLTIAAIAENITRWTTDRPDYLTQIPNLSLYRRDFPSLHEICLLEPSIIVVAQGEKQMLLGGESYPYGSEKFMIVSLDLPAKAQVIAASPEKPYLSLTLRLNLSTIAELAAHSSLPIPVENTPERAVGIGWVTYELLEPVNRLIRLLDEPDAIPVLAPMIEREIHYRLMLSDQASRLWQIASIGGQGHRVAKAINWLVNNYTATMRIDDLADYVQMSTSSLYHYFRQMTAMSPLQYQKWLRLSEARRLMLSEGRDAAGAAFKVGYESPSQFNREYTRLFGASPRRDVALLREQANKAMYSK